MYTLLTSTINSTREARAVYIQIKSTKCEFLCLIFKIIIFNK